jgi:benzoate 4-monooxygenase
LSYVRLVIKEGQRLWPVVATGPARVLLRDVDCGGGMTLPKGMEVRAAFFAMHRTPSIDRPDAFVPERWLPGDQDEAALKELFMPFSLGIRTCIGQNLALLEMTLVLATLYYSYDFELVGLAGEEAVVKEELFVTLKPKGAHFAVRKRVPVPPSTVESKHGDEE